MFIPQIVLVICAVHSACAFRRLPPTEQCESPLPTESGVACGSVRTAEGAHKYVSLRGLPYGAPPLGARRFAELEPVEPWSYLLDATEDAPACPQKDLIYGRIPLQQRGQSEDCIYLDINVPYDHFPKHKYLCNDTAGLPIVVMAHGGGFQTGSGLTDLHGPEYLMTTESVIVVSLNYRINVFGFLSLGTAKISGNQGLKDLIHGLRWVKRHARAFGGDPDNITLMGHSCGASMVHLLSLSKAAEGLFQRIFIMSGHAIPIYFASNPQFAEQIAADFVKHLGINSTDPDYIHETLINLPLEDIMYANSIIQYEYGLTSFGPYVDGITVEAEPLKLMAKGRGTQYPMMYGYTDNEAEFFKWVAYVWQLAERIKKDPKVAMPRRIAYKYPDQIDALANRTVQKCFNGDYSLENSVKFYNNLFFIYPILKLAEWRGLGGAPSYLYRYSYESERSIIKDALWTTYRGAAHVEDLTYIFRTNSLMGDYISFPPKNDDDRMKQWWVTLLTNFMKCGNPTCTEHEAEWPPARAGELQYQDISRPMEYRMKRADAHELDWLRFFESVDEEVRDVDAELKKNLWN